MAVKRGSGFCEMKYYLDTEFIENGKTIDLISIGIVCENGDSFYAENDECDFSKASQWVVENVFPYLSTQIYKRKSREQIKTGILKFIGENKPEFWGYYCDYDWVVFCQLFGTMMDFPKRFPMYCRDLKQLCDDLGNPELPVHGTGIHNALSDAEEILVRHHFLQGIPALPSQYAK